MNLLEGMQMKHGKFWARLVAVLCVAVLLLSMIPTALAASYPYETVSMDDVNMRSRANTTSTVLKKIKAGDAVTILGKTGDFYRVEFDGEKGYAMKKFIDGTDPSADAPFDESRTMQAPPAIYTYPYDTIVLQHVKLRKTAQPEGEVIRSLPAPYAQVLWLRLIVGLSQSETAGRMGAGQPQVSRWEKTGREKLRQMLRE